MVNLLAAAALAAANPAAASAPPAEPAMFVVRDADTTVYLFGTFHALDGDPQWFDRGVRDAFEQSNELVLEIVPPGWGRARRRRQAGPAGPRRLPSLRRPRSSPQPAWRSTPARLRE